MNQLPSDSPPTNPFCAAFGEPAECTAHTSDPALARLLSPQGLEFEVFRLLRAKLKGLSAERPLRCLGVVGAARYEGTSSLALGLAAALVQEPKYRVLVVEATLREPALERMLGLPEAPGLSEWLESEGAGPAPLRLVAPWGFCLLAGGKPLSAPAEQLGSERMADFLAAARDRFDIVIVDCPPLEPAADSVILQEWLDGFFLVVRARHTSLDAIRQALSHVKPDLVRGVIFNDYDDILRRLPGRRSRSPVKP